MGAEVRGAARLAKLVELALGDLDVSLPQLRVLELLAADEACAAGSIAGALAVSRPSVTGLMDGLVARGYVERVGDDADRRRVRHVLTGAGRRALRDAETAVAAAFERVLAPLPAGDRAAARQALRLWDDAIDRAMRDWQLAGR